ncbi:MAG: MFS transporter [Novosphingobium sp.]|nr:MFS transporter [Novosphingobium sp.]
MGPGSTLGPFRFPAFRAIWIANLFSNVGSMIQAVAAAWLMTDLTDSHRLIAMVQASTTLPILLFGVVAGAIADNFDRRRVMLVAQFAMLAASGVLALVTYGKLVNPFLLLLLTLLVGIGTALNAPAWQASVRAQVGRQDLPQAISLNSIAFNLARSVGPALGGLLISLWDISLAFALNALSYVALIVVLLRWHPQVEPPTRGPMFVSIKAGLQFCLTSGPVRRVLMRGATVGIGLSAYQALLPAVVRDRLGGDEIGFGLLLGAFGISSIGCALFAGKAMRRFGTERVIGFGTMTFAAADVVQALSQSMALSLLAAVAAGIGWVLTLTTLNVAMQVRSPDAILGRCLSVYQAITFGGMALGAWTFGAVADWYSLPVALMAAAGWLAATQVLLRLFAPMPQRGEGVHH